LSPSNAGSLGVRVGLGVFEATDPPEAIDFSSASFWQETVLLDGAPIYRVDFATPGTTTPRLVDALLTRRVDYWVARARLYEELCDRLGLRTPEPQLSAPTVSVAVCTHGRSAYLPRLFAALAELDPAPLEVIIVDNAPGENDCRAEVEARGFTYVREDRKGLDNARNTAVRHARGDLIAFTDDDCVPAPGWLRAMPRLFENPYVGAVTGPMFPFELESRSQQRMEAVAGMGRGYDELIFDWQSLSVAHGSAVGVGANMAFRRSALAALGPEPFPPELDAGTPTESGGDTYVFARMLAGNHLVIYSPELYGFHDHRKDDAALIRAVRGYGTGISAAMTRLLITDREFETWRGWTWLVKQFMQAAWRWVSGRADRRQVELSFEYVVGAAIGPWRWWRSHMAQRRLRAAPPPAVDAAAKPVSDPTSAVSDTDGQLAISVVIPSGGFGEALRRCLESLRNQSLAPEQYEVLVVDDRPSPPTQIDATLPRPSSSFRVLHSRGSGASGARNMGAEHARAEVVLFLDDDMVAGPTLLETHLARHAGPDPVAVVGSYLPYPVEPGLAAKAVGLWWSQHFETMRHGGHRTFAWMLSGNLSMRRDAFLEVGGFPVEIPFRREDYELGLRWLGAGHEIVYAPEAAVRHEFTLTTAARLRGVELEGFGDAMINRLYPGTSGVLPLMGHRPLGRKPSPRKLWHGVMRTAPAERATVTALNTLELLKLRRRWTWLLSKQSSTKYKQGMERADYTPVELTEALIDCELTDTRKLPKVGIVPPTVRVTHRGRELFRFRREEAFWNESVAKAISESVPGDIILSLGVERGWLRADDLPPERKRRPSVAVRQLREIKDRAAWLELLSGTREQFLVIVLGDQLDAKSWRDQALVPYDGPLVAASIGGGAPAGLPTQPMLLFRRTYQPSIRAAAHLTYLCFRMSALRELKPERLSQGPDDPLAYGFTLIKWLLDEEWTVAWRDVQGLLASQHIGPAAIGRAATVAELANVTDRRAYRGARTAAKSVTRALTELRHPDAARRSILSETVGSLEGVYASLRADSGKPLRGRGPDHSRAASQADAVADATADAEPHAH